MPQETVSFQQAFEQALAAQQQKNWDVALGLYQNALDQSQNQLTLTQASVIYHNMSTIAYEKNDFFKAYVWSRKAVTLNPSNRLASQSLEQFSKKFEVPKVAHQISGLENLQNILRLGSIDFWFGLSIILIFTTIWLSLKNVIQRKKNQIAQLSSKGFAWGSFITATFTIFIVALTVIRWNDDKTTHAIIINDKSAVQTAAGENKPVIFEAQPGIEVEVLQVQADYAQIRYPGAFSGWTPKKNIEILSLNSN